MNQINLIGRLTADPELRRTQDNTPVASYCLAVRRPHTKDSTDFINCVTWRQGAEFLSQYAHKGDTVAASGYLQKRDWQDKDGNKRSTFEVVADTVELVSQKRADPPQQSRNQPPQQNRYQPPQQSQYQQNQFGNFAPLTDDDSELPF